ncbi:hypothetical protein [Vibrio owensii]|uniref:hypothetical protein n=1 Tax=Vibrio harveyi group TaxID=717610 RepID=UPI003CC5F240
MSFSKRLEQFEDEVMDAIENVANASNNPHPSYADKSKLIEVSDHNVTIDGRLITHIDRELAYCEEGYAFNVDLIDLETRCAIIDKHM